MRPAEDPQRKAGENRKRVRGQRCRDSIPARQKSAYTIIIIIIPESESVKAA